LLNLNTPLEVVGEADDVVSGCRAIRRLTPELIFLDVNLKSGTGFDLLNQLPDLEAEVIFVTAHDDFALRAFDFAALGYLLKPLNARELLTAVNRYLNRRQSGGRERLDTLLTGNDPRRPDRLVIPARNSLPPRRDQLHPLPPCRRHRTPQQSYAKRLRKNARSRRVLPHPPELPGR